MDHINWQINKQLFPDLNPQDMEYLVSEFMRGKGEVKKDKPRRTVKKMELKGKGSFFVKHIKIKGWDTTLKYFFLPRKILTEWRIMNQLIGLDIPIPYPVALGINRKFGFLKEAFLITQSLGEMIDLHRFYKENIKNNLEKETFIKALITYLRFLHHKGVLHHDIHLENIIVPRERVHPLFFFLVDLYKTRIKRNPSEKEKMLNLALLIFYISEANLFGPNDQEKFIRLYYSEDDFSEAKLNFITKKIFFQIKKLRNQRFLSWGRKSFRTGKFFNIIKGKGKFLIYRWEFDPKLIPDILKEHEEITTSIRGIIHPRHDQLPPAILKTSRKAIVTKINIKGQTFIVKEGRNDALRASFRFWVARLRNRRSWANSNKLDLKSIPTPRGLALLEEKRLGVWMRSFLIMEYVEGAIPLRYYVQIFKNPSDPEVFQKKRAFISFMANFIRTLHQKGIYHGDLKSDNFLIKEKGENGWECLIVDTDRVYFGNRVSFPHLIKNFAQLNATIAQCLSPSNRIKFFKDYSEKNKWTRKQRKTIYRRILKICQSRNTEQYGVSFKKKHPPSTGDRSLKILHINTELTWRGGEQQALYLMEGLNQRGQMSHLICQPNSAIYERAQQKNIVIFPVRMKGEFDLGAAFKIARIIKKEKYDIVHSHTSHAHSLVMWASLLLRKKPVRIVSRRVDFSIFRHNFLGMNRYKYTKGADHIVAVAHKVKDVLIQDGIPSEKVSVVHSGADMDRFRGKTGDSIRKEFALSAQARILGNVGYLVGHKGQKHLIQAMTKVVQKFPEAHLLIVGKGELEKELKDLTAHLGLNKHITFTGFRSDVGALMNIFDMLVVSSTGEGLTATIVDALALEIPVVTTDAGGVPEIITHGETGIIVPQADPDALAHGIIWTLNNYDKAKEMAKRGKRDVVEKFSADAMVEGSLRIYQKICSAGRG